MEDLIVAKALPVNPSLLQAVQARGERHLMDALSFVCDQDSLSAVKSRRAEVQKEYDSVEEWRKALKSWAMEEYKRFEADYKAASKGYVDALALYSKEIKETEDFIKSDCEEGLREYFAELCAVRDLDWLTYERAGIKVDMSSAKAKTPKKLREQLEAFVAGVRSGVDIINSMDYSAEIMVEFRKHLDTTRAIVDVAERHHRIEEQKAAQEARKAEQEREAEMVRRVEALATPVVVDAPKAPKIYFMDFRAHGTMEQLKALKKFAADNNIELEAIKNE